MSSQPVGYRVVLICLFIGRGSEAVKVGGSVIYGIPFDSSGKISTGKIQKIKGIVIGSCCGLKSGPVMSSRSSFKNELRSSFGEKVHTK